MAGGRQPRDIDDVLDADRHAVQRSAQAARLGFRFGRLGGIHRLIGLEPDEGIEPGIEGGDAIEQRLRQRDRRQFLGGNRA